MHETWLELGDHQRILLGPGGSSCAQLPVFAVLSEPAKLITRNRVLVWEMRVWQTWLEQSPASYGPIRSGCQVSHLLQV